MNTFLKPFRSQGGQGKKRKLRKLRSRSYSTRITAEEYYEEHEQDQEQDQDQQVQVQGQEQEIMIDHENDDEDDDDDDADDPHDESEDDKAEKDDEKSRLAKFRVTMAGFTSHMESREGGSKTSEHSKLAAKRLWILLEGTYLRSRHTQLQPSAVAVFAWIVSLIETEFAHISKFLDELALRKGLKANTIKAYLTSAYIPFFIWHR
jgi:hypothetical protein